MSPARTAFGHAAAGLHHHEPALRVASAGSHGCRALRRNLTAKNADHSTPARQLDRADHQRGPPRYGLASKLPLRPGGHTSSGLESGPRLFLRPSIRDRGDPGLHLAWILDPLSGMLGWAGGYWAVICIPETRGSAPPQGPARAVRGITPTGRPSCDGAAVGDEGSVRRTGCTRISR